ncbi:MULTISPECIES: SMI1/KNR4 family protein [unclassified Spirillospora]|uniref:SMI1/KNR4 family protein n=1 Tax=unclassified Spirillospora TaxID=2642701 RepID=UPI00371F6941
MAEEIRRDPLLELIEFEVGDPVPEESINAAEVRFGTPLPAPLRRFYRSLGSVSLYWCFKSSLDERTLQLISEWDPYMIPAPGVFDGAVRIVPLEDLLFSEEFTMEQLEWQEGESEPEFDFNGTVYTNSDFGRMVRHFDAINLYYAMSFIVQPDHADWKMMLLGDHWIEYDNSRVTYLEDYLRYVIAARGLVSARVELFSEYRGDLHEPLRYDNAVVAGT